MIQTWNEKNLLFCIACLRAQYWLEVLISPTCGSINWGSEHVKSGQRVRPERPVYQLSAKRRFMVESGQHGRGDHFPGRGKVRVGFSGRKISALSCAGKHEFCSMFLPGRSSGIQERPSMRTKSPVRFTAA